MKGELKKAWRYQGHNMALPVANLEAALPFYAQVMGFRVLSRSDRPTGRQCWVGTVFRSALPKTAAIRRRTVVRSKLIMPNRF